MSAILSGSLFDAFNARFEEPQDVARSFVLPQESFALLCKPENSMLIGPRGSGKTTLLKMLKPAALAAWSYHGKSKILRGLSFRSAYVGMDSGWLQRLTVFPEESDSRRICETLHDASIATQVMASLVYAVIEYRAIDQRYVPELQRLALPNDKGLENEFVENLARLWRLDPSFLSLKALIIALEERLAKIDEIFYKISQARGQTTLSSLTEAPFLAINTSRAVQSFVSAFDLSYNNSIKTWAICLDELEILSPGAQMEILRSLRSTTNQHVRFKISASPFSRYPLPDADPTVPMSGNDFTPITLSYSSKADAVRFGRLLLAKLVADAGLDRKATEIFGPSQFEDEGREGGRAGSPYAPGGRRHASLSELERTDPSFTQYLRRRKINLNDMAHRTERDRAEIRKLIQIAEIRRQFGLRQVARVTGPIRQHRSTKRISDLYTGADALLTICEGNPRWLIGLFRPLLDEARHSSGLVSRERQARSVAAAIARYLSLLSTISYPTGPEKAAPFTKIVDRIGDAFFRGITSDTFKTEPALSFVIDHHITEEQLNAIGAAINQGAFVFIPSQNSEHCVGDIRNRRFRVSYLLCPRYKLPLMYGQSVTLSRLLSSHQGDGDDQYLMADLFR